MTLDRPPPQKKDRPRDELGRPLPWGASNRLVMEDYENLPLEENHRLGIEHFNAGRYFPAHEAWESAWRQSRDTEEEEFFKGLAQLGAGFTHYLRRNPHGARVLIGRGVSRISRYGPTHRGLDISRLVEGATAVARAAERAEREGGGLPALDLPRV